VAQPSAFPRILALAALLAALLLPNAQTASASAAAWRKHDRPPVHHASAVQHRRTAAGHHRRRTVRHACAFRPGNRAHAPARRARHLGRRSRTRRCLSNAVRRRARPKRHLPQGGGVHGSAPARNPIGIGSSANPGSTGRLAGDRFFVDPYGSAQLAVRALSAGGQQATADQLQAIAPQPAATWLTDAGSLPTLARVLDEARSVSQVPVVVVYDLPWRDCGQYSGGGAAGPADYQQFIDQVSAAIGQTKVVVVVEPDALSEMSCLPSAEQQGYYSLLHYAAKKLSANSSAAVYVDAGNPDWQPASVEAAGLNQVIAGTSAAGFAVNVANFFSTPADVAYGTEISGLTGGKHFIIDTSRNGGNVAPGLWCNPPGAALGHPPSTDTGNPLVDAELWIKVPGESDGSCQGGPSAGTFWLSYALQLAGE
jgi:endoglucanase